MEYPDEIHSLNNTRTHIQPGLTESPSTSICFFGKFYSILGSQLLQDQNALFIDGFPLPLKSINFIVVQLQMCHVQRQMIVPLQSVTACKSLVHQQQGIHVMPMLRQAIEDKGTVALPKPTKQLNVHNVATD